MTMASRFSVSTRWRAGPITLRLTTAEAVFLRERLAPLRPVGRHELSLLARLVRTEAAAPSGMWAAEARAVASPDQASLVRAQQAASLAGVGRAVYDALLERIVEVGDKRETSTRHRDHLAAVVEEHGPIAAKLDVDALEADIGVDKLRILTPLFLIDSETCCADRRSDPTPNNTIGQRGATACGPQRTPLPAGPISTTIAKSGPPRFEVR